MKMQMLLQSVVAGPPRRSGTHVVEKLRRQMARGLWALGIPLGSPLQQRNPAECQHCRNRGVAVLV